MGKKENQIKVLPTAEAVAEAALLEFVKLANGVVAAQGFFAVALAGGSTPKRLYQLLAQFRGNGFPEAWERIHFFFGDERHVPPYSEESNFKMVTTALLSHVKIPAENIHRVKAENPDASAAAMEYELEMKKFFTERNRMADGFPVFDLILLGMGPDGHTASLFPGSAGLEEKTYWMISNRIAEKDTDRITLTYPVLNHAEKIVFLVCGEDKATMIGEVLGSKAGEKIYPVQRVEPVNGSTLWLLDAKAASLLKS